MNKLEAIKLLESEGWTKQDVIRSLEVINFKTNPDELIVRRAISLFAGSELINRQRLQAAQKGLVTKKNKEIERKKAENNTLEAKIKTLISQNHELIGVNKQLKKDNKDLKNLVDEIRLKLAINTKKLLQYEESEIRKELVKLFKWALGKKNKVMANKNKTRNFNRMSYREIQLNNSKNRSQLHKEDQKWLKSNGYKNIGWNNVINFYQKIEEFLDKYRLEDLTLEELFLQADRIGNKYLTNQEIEKFTQRLSQEVTEIAEEIDKQLPDTEIEVIDFSVSTKNRSRKKHNQKSYRTVKL